MKRGVVMPYTDTRSGPGIDCPARLLRLPEFLTGNHEGRNESADHSARAANLLEKRWSDLPEAHPVGSMGERIARTGPTVAPFVHERREELLRRAQTQLDQADEERKAYIERLIADSRKIGELETHLLQLGSGETHSTLGLPRGSENIRKAPHVAEVQVTETMRE